MREAFSDKGDSYAAPSPCAGRLASGAESRGAESLDTASAAIASPGAGVGSGVASITGAGAASATSFSTAWLGASPLSTASATSLSTAWLGAASGASASGAAAPYAGVSARRQVDPAAAESLPKVGWRR